MNKLDQETCTHGVVFDKSKITPEMSTSEIRKLFPRLFGDCPFKCGFYGIAYASTEHYLYGDW